MPIQKKNQIEKFETVDESIEFLYDLFENRDVIDPEKFAVLLSLMTQLKLDAEQIASAIDKFYKTYQENKATS